MFKLKLLGIPMHTYTPNERKVFTVIIRGILPSFEENDIRLSLMENYELNPLSIKKFTTGYMRDNNIDSKIWIFQFDPMTDTKKVFAIRHICGCAGIRIELLKNKNITQCKNCFRYLHTGTNCSRTPRCYQCPNTHDYGECERDKNPQLKPYCVNCRADTHAANSFECPVYKRHAEQRNKIQKIKKDKINAYTAASNSHGQTHSKPLNTHGDDETFKQGDTGTIAPASQGQMFQIVHNMNELMKSMKSILTALTHNQQ